jgi:hypothetical protein
VRRREALRSIGEALAVILLVTACQAPLQGTPLPAGDPLPAALLGSLERRAASIHSVRGLANLSVDSETLRFRRPQRFAAERPDRLRVETLGLFNQIAAVLVTSEGRFQLFEGSQAGLQQGDVTRELLWEVARIDLAPSQIVELLLGTPPRSPGLRIGASLRFADGGTRVPLRDAEGRTRMQLDFDAEGRLRRCEQWTLFGDAEWTAELDDYRDLAGTPFAFEVKLHFPVHASEAVLRFREVELNPELAPELFVLRLPSAHTQNR